ncbi:MAG TPA: hypothetical protein ENH99_02235 [Candidatus Pacearchaeota archaeon]|nr:hypothetical protein [Candidatus Pacearchaeota archaeon]
MKKNVGIGVVIVLVVVLFFAFNGSFSKESQNDNEESVVELEENNIKNNCEGTKTTFDYSPVNLEKTKVFLPLGLMTGSHVTPIDHHYFQDFDNTGFDIEVYSPGDGFITSIQHMPGAKSGEDYRIVIEHTCTISSIYIHIGVLAERFKEHVPEDNTYVSLRVPVEAGELLGYYETNVDYNLVDEEVTLNGFVTPEFYEGEPWKIHVPDTYEYFNEPIKSQLIEKSLRTVEPISGKIDYDIDGRLVGNWFLEGTNGYAGEGTQEEDYWEGHLSIVYDAYDPERIVFSIGNYGGEDSKQFGIKGNSPDPATIGVSDGLVEYGLVDYDYLTLDGKSWNRKSLSKDLRTTSNEMVNGVVLVQMIEDRKIKFETFPGKTGSQVNDFTSNAKFYER